MLHLRMIYDEILKNSVFASSRPGRTDARVILILALLLKYKRLRRKMILFLIQHIDPCPPRRAVRLHGASAADIRRGRPGEIPGAGDRLRVPAPQRSLCISALNIKFRKANNLKAVFSCGEIWRSACASNQQIGRAHV